MEYMKCVLCTVRKELVKNKGNWPFIAKKAGVSYSFVTHVATGHTPNPRVQHVQKLLNVLKRIHDGEIVPPEK